MRRLLACSFIVASAAAVVVLSSDSTAAAQMSTLDSHRARAAAFFERRLDTLNALRVELADDGKKYEGACRGKDTTSADSGLNEKGRLDCSKRPH